MLDPLKSAVADLRTQSFTMPQRELEIKARIEDLGKRLAESRITKARNLMASFLQDAKYLAEAFQLHQKLYGNETKGSEYFYKWAVNVSGLSRKHVVTLLEIQKAIRTWPKSKGLPTISSSQFQQLMRLPEDYISGVLKGDIRLGEATISDLKVKSNPNKLHDVSLERLVDTCIEDDRQKFIANPTEDRLRSVFRDGRSLATSRKAARALFKADQYVRILNKIFQLWQELPDDYVNELPKLGDIKEYDRLTNCLLALKDALKQDCAFLKKNRKTVKLNSI